MAALREAPQAARQLLRLSNLRIASAVPRLHRYASTEAAPATSSPNANSPIPDLEAASGLATPIVTREGIEVLDPRRRASRRKHELPHERYQYHPPKYDRGPLHPVQPPPSSDPVARDFAPGPFNLPRLKQTYQSTIAQDLMALTYQHVEPGNSILPPLDGQLREWDDSSPYMKNRPLRKPRGDNKRWPIEQDITWRNVPELVAVHVSMFVPAAKKNFDHLRVAKVVLQNITGVKPEMTKTKSSVAQWGAIKGDKTGWKATMRGNQAYEFLDKCVHLVFPKIKEWKGIKGSTGDGTGNLSWGFSEANMLYFPEIEANYALYPAKMIPGCRIFVETSAKSDRHARLLFLAMGIPFDGKLVN